MIVRGLDDEGDWLFGKGKNDYKAANNAVAQAIQTRLGSFLGDCFFDLQAGLDWFSILGTKDQTVVSLAIRSAILNTENVTGILEIVNNLDRDTRELTVSYKVQTTFGVVNDIFQYSLNGLV